MRAHCIILFMFIIVIQYTGASGVTLTVSSDQTYDDQIPGNGVCYTGQPAPDNCTLRAAIQEANALPGPDHIIFDRPLNLPYPNLPPIQDSLILDGSGQWTTDTIGARPGVSIGADSIVINADDTTIIGLMFFGDAGTIYQSAGIKVGPVFRTRIGGPGDNERNIFISRVGILINGYNGSLLIQYNYFGVIHKYFGAYLADDQYMSDYGIYCPGHFAMDEIVIEHNLIGECGTGIFIYASSGDGLTIRDNKIGHPNLFGSFSDRIPNGTGIYFHSDIGSVLIENNTIVDNIRHQIELFVGGATTIRNNWIGHRHTDYSILPSRGDGIHIQHGVFKMPVELTGNSIENINGNGIAIDWGIASLIINDNDIGGNKENGIALSNTIGNPEKILITENRILANYKNGILLDHSENIHIRHNFIGVVPSYDFDLGNKIDGISIVNGSTNNLIGGPVDEDGNQIGDNKGNGIYVGGAGTRDNYVAGNSIGYKKDASGIVQKAGNGQHGIALYDNSESNNIGLSGDIINPNLIMDNHWRGIAVINSNYNRIFGNLVGTDKGSLNWGNGYSGIQIVGNNNLIKSNTVAYNGSAPHPHQAGIIVEGSGSFGNQLSENSIYHNAAAGIALINGGNQNLQPPTLMRHNKTLTGSTYPQATVEFFSGPEEDEGKYFEGSLQADQFGNYSWQIPGHVWGKHITATSTYTPIMDTSEFSLPVHGYAFPWPMFLPAIISDKK